MSHSGRQTPHWHMLLLLRSLFFPKWKPAMICGQRLKKWSRLNLLQADRVQLHSRGGGHLSSQSSHFLPYEVLFLFFEAAVWLVGWLGFVLTGWKTPLIAGCLPECFLKSSFCQCRLRSRAGQSAQRKYSQHGGIDQSPVDFYRLVLKTLSNKGLSKPSAKDKLG